MKENNINEELKKEAWEKQDYTTAEYDRYAFDIGFNSACKIKDAEIERLNQYQADMVTRRDNLIDEIEKLKAQLEKAEKCLKFYANWANYKDQKLTIEDFEEIMFYWNFTELIGGKRAREYFKQRNDYV